MGKSPPFMKLYWNDLIASCRDMDGPEFGAYMYLLGYQWQHGHLPANDLARRRVAGFESNNSWPAVWNSIKHRFAVDDDGKLIHERLRAERDQGISVYETRAQNARENGKLGGRPKNPENPDITQIGLQKKTQRSSGSRSLDLQFCEDEEADRSEDLGKNKGSIAEDLKSDSTDHTMTLDRIKTPELREAVETWLAHKREQRQGYKPTGFKSLISRVMRLAVQHGDEPVIEAIERAIANGWKGFDHDIGKKSLKHDDGLLDDFFKGGR